VDAPEYLHFKPSAGILHKSAGNDFRAFWLYPVKADTIIKNQTLDRSGGAVMIKKIVSSGQPGVERAALDVAIKLDIPHGGWIARGRRTDDGVLSRSYFLKETPSCNYSEAIQKNVVDSDGSFILIRGESTDLIKLTLDLVERYNRPYLLLDLKKIRNLKAANLLVTWIEETKIEILHVTGNRAGDDPKIYQCGINILESMIYLGLMGDEPAGFIQTPRARSTAAMENNPPDNVKQAVDRLTRDLPLKEKIMMANLTFGELNSLQKILGQYIREKFELISGNPELMASCSFVNKKAVQNESEASMVIIEKLWEQLRKTHKLRVIK
jgi:hypothetical protein